MTETDRQICMMDNHRTDTKTRTKTNKDLHKDKRKEKRIRGYQSCGKIRLENCVMTRISILENNRQIY